MKVNKTDATMPQPRQQQQHHQQPSKPKRESPQLPTMVKTSDFKKVFEAEVKKRYGDKVASKVIFL